MTASDTPLTNQESSASLRETLIYWCKVIVFFLIVFGFGYLPPIGPLTPTAMKILGIFIGLLYGWVVLSFVWTSLVAIIALSMSGYCSLADVIAKGFGNNITVFVTLMFIYAAYLTDTGLCNKAAYWFLSRKFVVNHPWRLVLMLMLAAYCITVMTYIYPALILMWNITYQICNEVGYKKGNKFPALMVIAVGIAATGGYLALPIKSAQALAMGLLASASQGAVSIDFFRYMAYMLPVTLLTSVFLVVLIMKYVFKADVSKLMNVTEEQYAEHREAELSLQEKIGVYSLAVFILLMCLPSVMPKAWYITKLLTNYGMSGSIIVLIIALTISRLNKKPLFDLDKLANSGGISWNAIVMLAACLPVADAMGADKIGIMKYIMDYMTPYLAGMSPFVFCAFTLITINCLTQVAHNTVLVVMFTPLFYKFSVILGVDPAIIVILLVYACNMALGSPAASAGTALIYLNEWASNKLTYSFTWVTLAVGWIILLLSIPLALLV
ncbi:SLC13 family permease [Pelotomaculum propionicicum]|uniref:Citrate transporter-like domain-containing protein n=1 Tax=Pelotomaculum propionicicum TaxID=258475 RepID=A0A4Y7RS73_9FIRM|nr:SLC13 family permease [Pelotomaculum propionicicum]TEB11691.1 hypothetical protein Pmgp_01487 [Pelotomaculum propionicicum]